MSRLSEACSQPFSNGTEVEAWMDAWCDNCERCRDGDADCDLLLAAFVPDDVPWPEAWLPEPDDGEFFLPSRMVCLAFKPGPGGDPHADERSWLIESVQSYWREAS